MIIKKLLFKDTKKRVYNVSFEQPQSALQSFTLSNQTQTYEGVGKGLMDCLVLSGSGNIVVENCVCKLQDFSGTLTAKNSQLYILSTDACKISCVNTSIDITNHFSGSIDAVKSLIQVDPFYGSISQESSISIRLLSAFCGDFSSVAYDHTSVIDCPTKVTIPDDIFDSNITVEQLNLLLALPTLNISENEMIFRIGERYLHVILNGDSVESTNELFKTDAGTLIDASGNVFSR